MGHPRITKKILEFTRVLKDADVIVSPAETIDLMHALPLVDFTDRAQFRQTLATTLVKDYTDIPVFNRCFEEFFEKKAGKDGSLETALADLKGRESARDEFGLSPEELQSMQDEIDRYLESLPEEILLSRSPREILNLMLEDPAVATSGGGLGMMLLNARARASSGSANEPDEGEGGNRLANIILPRIQRRMRERNVGNAIHKREQYLLNRFLYQLKPAEVQEMRELVKRFGQKLKNRISLRKKRMKRGGLDVKRTFRSNLPHGGIPFKLYFRNRRIDRPQLVVMCDISSSVNQYSRFMLLLTYTLQSLFSKVRTFAFISRMVEITPLFMEMNPERALNSIFTDTDFTYGWGSNYGRCFDIFMREYSDSCTRKTTVIIIGDARNNNQDPGLDAFTRMKERVRNVYWLNPEKRHLWDWSDSIASVYGAHCTEMKEVNNFLDLSEFIDKLFTK
jgi:uncharacterized protein